MKKLISTITLAVVMMFGSTYTFADTCVDGIIVFGNSGIIVFGVVIGDNPCAPGLGAGGIIISD